MHPENEDRYTVRRLVCHACRAVNTDIDKLTDPAVTRFMYFVPVLDD